MVNVFLDSDVVVSSLISNNGASYQLVYNNNVICFISNISYQELLLVVKKLKLDDNKLKIVTKKRFKIIRIVENLKKIKIRYRIFTKDLNDTHIVAGAVESKANFLITYNIKDFEINKIKEKFNIKIMTPGTFLQFLRSK